MTLSKVLEREITKAVEGCKTLEDATNVSSEIRGFLDRTVAEIVADSHYAARTRFVATRDQRGVLDELDQARGQLDG